jgi:hypothetical protein
MGRILPGGGRGVKVAGDSKERERKREKERERERGGMDGHAKDQGRAMAGGALEVE